MISFDSTPFATSPAVDWSALAKTRHVRLDAAMADAFIAHGPAVASKQQLIQGALCVTTGQQPGLFTGPLFTMYKALTAVALARRIASSIAQPVVPVFWVAGDDHDFQEANHCAMLDGSGDLLELELPPRAPNRSLFPLYQEPLGPAIEQLLARLRETLPEAEFKNDTVDWLARHYRATTDFSVAFGSALAELLGRYGLVVFQPSHPAAKRAMVPWLVKAATQAASLDRVLELRASALLAAGREVPVTVGEGATMIMMEGEIGRDRLVLQDGLYRSRRSGKAWQLQDVVNLITREPHRFSANVLLRPVVEAAILPTLAYVGGPSELSYLAQTDPLYEELEVVAQARVPRWSARAIEPRVARVLEKYGITAEGLVRDGDRLTSDLLRDEIPADGRAAMAKLKTDIEISYASIIKAAVGIDPTLQKAVESARNAALGGLNDVEKRLLAHLKRRTDLVSSQLRRARTSLAPKGQPQERILSAVSFLGEHGGSFLDEGLKGINLWVDRLEALVGES